MSIVDGQKIAKKLCSNIGKETKRCKNLLADYNVCTMELCSGEPPALLSDVLMLSSNFWNKSQRPSSRIEQVPWKIKEEAVQAFLIFHRSKEDLELLEKEMICTVSYLLQRKKYITNKLCELDTMKEDLYLKGAKCLLEHLKWDAEFNFGKAFVVFSRCIDLPAHLVDEKSCVITVEESDDESEVDSEVSDIEDYDSITVQ